MWGGSVILGTAILTRSSSLFGWAYSYGRQNRLRDVTGPGMLTKVSQAMIVKSPLWCVKGGGEVLAGYSGRQT